MRFHNTNETSISTDTLDLVLPESQILSSSVRFTIMLIIYVHKKAGFTDLQKLLHLTPGKLDYHIKKLIDANYVQKRRIIFPKRPLLFIEITNHGKTSFKEYVSKLRNLLNIIE